MVNIKRSQPAPKCLSVEKLKKNGDYKCGNVIERLQHDFHNKCYLCEEKEPSTINVEHLVPHKGTNKDLMFDWNNLFWSCGHCNNTKLAKYEKVLDCTNNSKHILDLLKFEIRPFPVEVVEVFPLNQDVSVIETAQLLNEIYNGTTKLKITEGLNIKKKILDELISFNELLHEYFNNDDKSVIEKVKEKVEQKLSTNSAFTAFKVWIVKSNSKLYEEFGEMIPQLKNNN